MRITLNNGIEMPLLGFGTYQLLNNSECEECVRHALNTGYRLIDTAAAYGNEEAVGRAIKKSKVKREDIFVTTKFIPTDRGYEKANQSLEQSLQRLGLDYIDLYLMHLPQGDVNAAWLAMEELYKEGKARAIGVSNFTLNDIQRLTTRHAIIPSINQLETHPFSQKPEMQRELKTYGIQLESWSPFAQGKKNLFINEVLQSLSLKYNKSIAQVVLRWLIQRKIVSIPKSSDHKHIWENFKVFDFQLSSDDMTGITSLDTGGGVIYHV